MALPPLPAFATKRVKLTYQVGVDEHNMYIRVAPDASGPTIDAEIAAFFTALAPALNLITITNYEEALLGSNVFLPQPSGTLGDTYGTGVPTGQGRAWAYTFTGRSTSSGRRNRVEVFGAKVVNDASFRVLPSEGSWVAPTLNILNTSSPAVWCAIDGGITLWNQYVNVKQNDVMVKKIRGGL